MGMNDISRDEIECIIDFSHVVAETVDGRCATAGDFSSDADGVVRNDEDGERIAHIDSCAKRVTMNGSLDSHRFAIERILVFGYEDWTVSEAGDSEEFNRICEGEGQ